MNCFCHYEKNEYVDKLIKLVQTLYNEKSIKGTSFYIDSIKQTEESRLAYIDGQINSLLKVIKDLSPQEKP